MDRISDAERLRIAELLAEGTPAWRLHKEINRSRFAIRRAVVALHRLAEREPRRSPLRLSLAEREEVSRGLAVGEPVGAIARRLGRAPSTVCREVAANGGRDRYRACAAGRRVPFWQAGLAQDCWGHVLGSHGTVSAGHRETAAQVPGATACRHGTARRP